MTALDRLERRIDTELCLDACPHAEGVDLGYHARSLVRQGYTEQAAWAKARAAAYPED